MYQVRYIKALRALQFIGSSETAPKTSNINFRSLSKAQNHVCMSVIDLSHRYPNIGKEAYTFFPFKSHVVFEI